MTTRRGLLSGIIGLIAAPAIVRASSLMPVKTFIGGPYIPDYSTYPLGFRSLVHASSGRDPGESMSIFDDATSLKTCEQMRNFTLTEAGVGIEDYTTEVSGPLDPPIQFLGMDLNQYAICSPSISTTMDEHGLRKFTHLRKDES